MSHLTAAEAEQADRDGYVVREGVFTDAELEQMIAASEDLVRGPLHQDYPYWVEGATDAARIATAIIYLDDATLENGCLEVSPGSHLSGQLANRTDADDFGRLEMDPVANADLLRVPVEVKAGSVVLFGAFLAHATGPNTSDTQRRALLYSYQPAGWEHSLEGLRRFLQPGHR